MPRWPDRPLWVEDENGCWLWQRAPIPNTGYGLHRFEGRRVLAHRWSYEQHVGPIPEGMTIDHLCRVRHCVNPTHMQVVTRGQNTLNGDTITAANAAKTHCHVGHLLAGDNVRIRRDGARVCVPCARERNKLWMREDYARKRAARAG